eukprot:CAMPEP_0116076554 /NCGR_PEP_ID=MMETSP0322-20121206/17342_1 /TAXON_ID=163516 /ORGANISM="Leptocylindrus danicus var. apora, Strain B651" /LENGTH=421 /DNA_ID=CAMNT_0003566911 /DNA_START=118 /DNA_END=1383 /DNA_ORIENTATION=+
MNWASLEETSKREQPRYEGGKGSWDHLAGSTLMKPLKGVEMLSSYQTWDKLAGSKQMKPLKVGKSFGGSHFDELKCTPRSSSFDNMESILSCNAPSTTVWEHLISSHQMKPLHPASINSKSFLDVLLSPTQAQGIVCKGNIWDKLESSQRMKPLKHKVETERVENISASNVLITTTNADIISIPSIDLTGNVWENLSGSKRMKPLKPLKFNGNAIQKLGSPIPTQRGPSLPAVKVLHPGVDDIITAGFSIDAGSIPTPNYWARLSGSTAMKPLNPLNDSPGKLQSTRLLQIAIEEFTFSDDGTKVSVGNIWNRMKEVIKPKFVEPTRKSIYLEVMKSSRKCRFDIISHVLQELLNDVKELEMNANAHRHDLGTIRLNVDVLNVLVNDDLHENMELASNEYKDLKIKLASLQKRIDCLSRKP